jgi:hypothetical protein
MYYTVAASKHPVSTIAYGYNTGLQRLDAAHHRHLLATLLFSDNQ